MSEDLAWAAGFFDGEGSTFVHIRKPHLPKNPNGSANIQLRVCQVRPEPLHRFLLVVGEGKINGPYEVKNTKGSQSYEYRVSAQRAEAVLIKLWPWLSEPKREQAEEARRKLMEWKKEKVPA